MSSIVFPIDIRQDTIRRSERQRSHGQAHPARDAARDILTPLDREPLPSEIEEAAVRFTVDEVAGWHDVPTHLVDRTAGTYGDAAARATVALQGLVPEPRTGTDDTGPR